ncbi:MAG: CvpA family protein [Alphaproteobacteria bacterium]|nr:CvpA family protein [Alphaproteobacteria bacterium]
MISSFNTFDVAILAIIVIFGLIGFSLGITRMLLGIAGWVGAAFFTFYAYLSNGFKFIRPFVRRYITDPFLCDLVIGLVLFVVFLMILNFLNRSISTYVKKSILGGIDRSLGLLLGFTLAGGLLSSVFLMANLMSQPKDWPHAVQTARSVSILASLATSISKLLPPSILENLGLNPMKIQNNLSNNSTCSEKLVESLSRPQPSRLKQKEEGKKSQDYKKEQVTEMDRLFENNE